MSNSSFKFCRDIDLTEKLDYSSAVALLGYSLILSLLRAFNVKDEATRVMFAAPILAFVTTHILYLNFYELDYGKVAFLLLLNFCHRYTKSNLTCISIALICNRFSIPLQSHFTMSFLYYSNHICLLYLPIYLLPKAVTDRVFSLVI